jgi:transcription-repair coupling factor (superfamily II helicase)
MRIQDLQQFYGSSPQAGALVNTLENNSLRTVFLQGLVASAAPMLFASVAGKVKGTILFVLQDADEAGYFYHDLTQIMGQEDVLFFPSSYRRAVKYGQRDSANEILRTEVFAKIGSGKSVYVVTSPEALSELVVSRQNLDERTLTLKTGQTIDVSLVVHTLKDFGFVEQDYVYEPGQFALRGSILDIYSYTSEYPFRIDFFGDDIDTIRTFEVQDQLSKDRREEVEIVPELAKITTEKVPFLHFLPQDAILVMKDFVYVHDTIEQIYNDGFSSQAMTERMEGATEMEQQQIVARCNANGNCSHRRSSLKMPQPSAVWNLVTNPRAPRRRQSPSILPPNPFSIRISTFCASRSTIISCEDTASISLPIVPSSSRGSAKSSRLLRAGAVLSRIPLRRLSLLHPLRIPSSPL